MQSSKTQSMPSIAIIGAGKLGRTVGIVAREKGYSISAISGRDLPKLAEFSSSLGSPRVCVPSEAAACAEIVFLSVSDDAIEPLCSALASSGSFKPGQIVTHFSGALSSEVLASAKTAGALVASTHPLQTFSSVDSALNSLPGTFWFCEGDAQALSILMQLITEIGGLPRIIPTQKKALYHAASVIACNYLDTLMDIALNVAEAAELERDDAWQALQPLIQATLRNISASGTTNALTGPIARGDLKTVSRHLEALAEKDAQIETIYRVLGKWTTGIAVRKGLNADMQTQLLGLLNAPWCRRQQD